LSDSRSCNAESMIELNARANLLGDDPSNPHA
jgi:hypothetical protein